MNSTVIGIAEQKIDSKNRIILPSFTHVKDRDSVAFFRDDAFLSIYGADYITKLIDEFHKEDLKRFKDFLVLKRKYDELCSRVVSRSVVDKQRRVLLPSVLRDFYQFKDNVVIVGALDHINIFRNREDAFGWCKGRNM